MHIFSIAKKRRKLHGKRSKKSAQGSHHTDPTEATELDHSEDEPLPMNPIAPVQSDENKTNSPASEEQVRWPMLLTMNIEDLSSHYYYASCHALHIYGVIFAAIIFRRSWILNGVTAILVKLVFEKLLAWGFYFSRLKEAQQGIKLIRWLCVFGLSTAEGAIQGKNVSRWMAGSAIRFWTKTGQGFLFAWWRHHSSQMNDRIVTDIRKNLADAERSRCRVRERSVRLLSPPGEQ